MLFKELARLGAEQLAKQKPVTLEKAREQVRRIEARISKRKETPWLATKPQETTLSNQ